MIANKTLFCLIQNTILRNVFVFFYAVLYNIYRAFLEKKYLPKNREKLRIYGKTH